MYNDGEAEGGKGGKFRAIKLTTVKEGTHVLAVSEGRLYEMIRTGVLPPGVVVLPAVAAMRQVPDVSGQVVAMRARHAPMSLARRFRGPK